MSIAFAVLGAAMNMWTQLTAPTTGRKKHEGYVKALTTRVLEYISEHPGCNSIHLRSAMGEGVRRIQDCIYRLEQSGRIMSRVRPIENVTRNCPRSAKHFWRLQ